MSPRGRPSRRQRGREQARPAPQVAEERSFEVTAAGDRLDKLVAARFPDLSRARVQQLISAALVDVDGEPAAPADRPRGPEPELIVRESAGPPPTGIHRRGSRSP